MLIEYTKMTNNNLKYYGNRKRVQRNTRSLVLFHYRDPTHVVVVKLFYIHLGKNINHM